LRMCPAERGMIHSADPCRHPTVHSRKFGDTASHLSLFMWSRIVDRGSDDRFRVDFIGERSVEAATSAPFQAHCLSPTSWPVFNTSKSEHTFFPIQQWRSSCWSLSKPLLERSHHMRHGLSRGFSIMHPHTCHQALLNRVTACVSHTENATKFPGYGKPGTHYLRHCCQTTVLHCSACCAVLCCVNLNWVWVRIVWVYGDFSTIVLNAV
jgi:hypothetical protein